MNLDSPNTMSKPSISTGTHRFAAKTDRSTYEQDFCLEKVEDSDAVPVMLSDVEKVEADLAVLGSVMQDLSWIGEADIGRCWGCLEGTCVVLLKDIRHTGALRVPLKNERRHQVALISRGDTHHRMRLSRRHEQRPADQQCRCLKHQPIQSPPQNMPHYCRHGRGDRGCCCSRG